MATWTKATGDPITVERTVAVRNISTGAEGFVHVSWENKYHMPRFYGPVMRRTGVIVQPDGLEDLEPTEKVEILDQDPDFL